MKLRIKLLLLILLIPFVYSGCKKSLNVAIHDLYNREINMSWRNVYIDDDMVLPDYAFNKPIKIVVYVDSTLCLSCFGSYLERVNDYMLSQNKDSVEYICVLRPRPIEIIQELLREVESSNVSIVMDVDDVFIKKNSLEQYTDVLTSFLLDENNRVLVIGDPVRNKEVRELYKKTLSTINNRSKKKHVRFRRYSKQS